MCRIAYLTVSIFKIFRGSMPPDPPRKARALPSQWSLRDHCGLNHISSQVSRLQLSKSWQVCSRSMTHPPARWTAASHHEADRVRSFLRRSNWKTTACWRGHQHSERAPSGWALAMFPGLQLQSHKSPKLLCCRAAILFSHLDSSSSAVLSHEAAERPLSLVLFLSRLSRNRKTKLWRALLLRGRLTQLFSDREKWLFIADVQDVPIEARSPIDDIAKTDEFTRHGRSWALCYSSQLRPPSSLRNHSWSLSTNEQWESRSVVS